MMNNTLLTYNQTITFTMEEHSIEELMKSYMMYKIGKRATIIQQWVFIAGRIRIISLFYIAILLSLISCFQK